MEYVNFHAAFNDNITHNTIKQIYKLKFKYLVAIFSDRKIGYNSKTSKDGIGIKFITAKTTFTPTIVYK
jgi:hypothetical protein